MFFMAIWLAGTVFFAIVATQNFYTIDRLLTGSPNGVFRHAVDTMTSTPTVRELLRYLASELNRLYFQYWNLAQLPLGILEGALTSGMLVLLYNKRPDLLIKMGVVKQGVAK